MFYGRFYSLVTMVCDKGTVICRNNALRRKILEPISDWQVENERKNSGEFNLVDQKLEFYERLRSVLVIWTGLCM